MLWVERTVPRRSSLNQVLTSLRTKTKAVEDATDQGIPAQALFLMLKLCVGTSLVHTMRTVSQSQAGHIGRNDD